ncbi:electron transport complex protein RnfD [Catenovulum agarivorans DS-2]|uniref:Ion-translocating oxidoreductase complex subunit D n=1 Tax=Catenovulum agarivorans DS-2 TaxID=1328313 RepID=W7QPZ2_9ALTE|nr:electron transport complex subunit RsxD [Catenovulum agarivorans]EWH11057.1 electron transport complex protein RnfD [Catenovulum agarivorans DS-2]
MNFRVASSPHNHVKNKTSRVMALVALACIPGIITQVWYFGFGTLFQILLAVSTAIIAEALCLQQRDYPVKKRLKDNSALLTGLLLGISLPPLAPWWIAVIGSLFAIIIAKQIYGGLGQNIFNPAMAGYVALLVSFPLSMTLWLPPLSLVEYDITLFDTLMLIFTGYSETGYSLAQLRVDLDGFTMATPLDTVKTGLTNQQTFSELSQLKIFSEQLGIGWTAVNLAYLFGGLVLIWMKVISWRIPLTFLVSLFLLSWVAHVVSPDGAASASLHLLSGATMFGAFFILTDPVSASTTPRGKIIFALLVALLVFLIRQYGGYPEAIAFAVLLANMCVPLIDYYTKPRVYGHAAR